MQFYSNCFFLSVIHSQDTRKRRLTVGLLGDILQIILSHLEVQGNGSGLDGNTTVLLILTGVHETGITGTSSGNNTGLGDKGIGKGGLSVID